MDPIVGLLDGVRARGAFLLRSSLRPPWSIRVQDEAPLTLVVVARGQACALLDDDQQAVLEAGTVAIFRGPDAYVLADSPETAPTVVIHPGQRCETPEGVEVPMASLGVRAWGNANDGDTMLITGTYEGSSEVARRLLVCLPPFLQVGATEPRGRIIDVLLEEMLRDAPGQDAVLDRILDVVLVEALRAWFALPGSPVPAWYVAQSDPIVGQALRLMHEQPESPWTVASLAVACSVSRATFARRFAELVGDAPMTYLTEWRLALAADLLREPGVTLGSVARQVGYGTPYALSAAFKRVRGASPREYLALSSRSAVDVPSVSAAAGAAW